MRHSHPFPCSSTHQVKQQCSARHHARPSLLHTQLRWSSTRRCYKISAAHSGPPCSSTHRAKQLMEALRRAAPCFSV